MRSEGLVKITFIEPVKTVRIGLDNVEIVNFRYSFVSSAGKNQIRQAQVLKENAKLFNPMNAGERIKVGDNVNILIELKGREKGTRCFNLDEVLKIKKV